MMLQGMQLNIKYPPACISVQLRQDGNKAGGLNGF